MKVQLLPYDIFHTAQCNMPQLLLSLIHIVSRHHSLIRTFQSMDWAVLYVPANTV